MAKSNERAEIALKTPYIVVPTLATTTYRTRPKCTRFVFRVNRLLENEHKCPCCFSLWRVTDKGNRLARSEMQRRNLLPGRDFEQFSYSFLTGCSLWKTF